MIIRFPRDENGNIKHKKPCQTPGCNWPNYHVCLVGKPDTTPRILRERAKIQGRTMGERTSEHREKLAQSQRERWERIRERNRPRDEKIIARYMDGDVGVKKLQEEFGLGYRAISTILHEAAERGEIVIRPRGLNVRHQQRSAVGAYN
jgi:hypothetical protein